MEAVVDNKQEAQAPQSKPIKEPETTGTKKDFVPGNKLLIGIVLSVLTFWLFAQTLLNVSQDIQKTLPIQDATLNMAISITSLFSGCFIVLAGGLADKLGCVKLTYTGIALSIIGSLCLILATGAGVFVAGRVIQGLSAACIMPSTLSIIKEYYKDKERQRAISFWSMGSWGGSGVASLAGGLFATYLGWKSIFIVSIAVSIVSFLMIVGTPETTKSKSSSKFDLSGLVFFLVSLISLNIVITKGTEWGWLSTNILVLAAVCIIAFLIFFKIEAGKRDAAFIDFALFKSPVYSGAVFSNFMLNAVAGTLIVVNGYVQSRGFNSFQSGMLTIGYLVSVLVMIRVGEKLMQKQGYKKPMLSSSVICCIGIVLMTLTFLPNTFYLAAVFIGYILYGTGLGMYATPSTDTAVSNLPADKTGIGSGIYKMASSLGGAFGVAISSSVVASLKISHGMGYASVAGLIVNIAFCVLSFIAVQVMVPSNPVKK